MKRFFLISAVLMMVCFVSSCSSDSDGKSDDTPFQVKTVANSGCKKTGSESRAANDGLNPEYIEYKAIGNGYLSLNHVNTYFNCQPGELNIQATLEGNEIKILETEEQALVKCICPYDLYCEIGPLKNEKYTIVVYKKTLEDGAYARFSISYSNTLSGKVNTDDF